MTIKEIIERISLIRANANLSARELSLIIGKNPAYISQLENTASFEPSLSTLLDILAVCNVSVEEFFYHNMEQYANDKKLLDFFSSLSEKQKEAIIHLYEV
ncbi:MAG: helix-turn-helix transcriptional regulator [Clostridia bacterium]|nr:helix-turn-helix transcriptional regulator [Clostridia bacterium]MBQ7913682.1 helix-turn-helix transcriptional regulator [Clostridia bacterium]